MIWSFGVRKAHLHTMACPREAQAPDIEGAIRGKLKPMTEFGLFALQSDK